MAEGLQVSNIALEKDVVNSAWSYAKAFRLHLMACTELIKICQLFPVVKLSVYLFPNSNGEFSILLALTSGIFRHSRRKDRTISQIDRKNISIFHCDSLTISRVYPKSILLQQHSNGLHST